MFASTLFADENDVRDFDMQIQNLLRQGRADEAAAILETALGQLGDASHPVVALCQACPIEAVEIIGWEAQAARLAELGEAGAATTALGIDISWPGHMGIEPDADGILEPLLESNYYADAVFPFATRDRAALLEGYRLHGPEWQGRMAEIDTVLSVRGLGALYGTVYPMVESITATPDPEPLDADAMRLGAAFVAVRVHQAVVRAIHGHGLPRPLAVIVGSNESYPYYDAPVVSTAESREFVSRSIEDEPVAATLTETAPAETPQTDADVFPADEQQVDTAADADKLVIQLSGASLRQRLGQQNASENLAREQNATSGLLRRLFTRKVATG